EEVGAGVDRHREVLHAVGGRGVGVVAGDDRDDVVAVGAVDHRRAAAADAQRLDVDEADRLVGVDLEAARVAGRAGREGHGVGGDCDDVEQVAGRHADGVAAVDGDGHRGRRGDVEGVAAGQAVDLEALDVRVGDRLEAGDADAAAVDVDRVGAAGAVD